MMTPRLKTRPSTSVGWMVTSCQPMSRTFSRKVLREAEAPRILADGPLGRSGGGEGKGVSHLRVVASPKVGGLAKRGLSSLDLLGSYPLGLAGVGAHARGKVVQLPANLSGKVSALQAIRAEGEGWWVSG